MAPASASRALVIIFVVAGCEAPSASTPPSGLTVADPPPDGDALELSRVVEAPAIEATGFELLGDCAPPAAAPPAGHEWLRAQQVTVTADWVRTPIRTAEGDVVPFDVGEPVTFTILLHDSAGAEFDPPPIDEPVYWLWANLELEAPFSCSGPSSITGGWRDVGRFGRDDVTRAIAEREAAGDPPPTLQDILEAGHAGIHVDEPG